MIHPVILSGGAGTRLWPLSRTLHPKQFMALASDVSLLQETIRRVTEPSLFAAPTVVCNEAHRFVIAEQLREMGVAARRMLLEPVARNTAPAIASAAFTLPSRDDLMLVLPSDHAFRDSAAFEAAVRRAVPAAQAGALVVFGVKPTRPETGYGYIRRGRRFDQWDRVHRVRAFVEKPDAARAARFLEGGEHEWNAGIFLFSAAAYLAELERLQPQMLIACREAVERGTKDLDFFRLDKDAFARAPSISIDYAVMEHASQSAVVELDAGWSDVGTWAALWDEGTKDREGNVSSGPVAARDAKGNYLRSDGPVVAALGVNDLMIVATPDAVLVAPRSRAQDVKLLVDDLKGAGRTEVDTHPTVFRPWGSYRTIDAGARFIVKRITVKPRASLSLQRHKHRAEHWVVVSGEAEVTRGEERFRLKPNESTYIPLGTIHRLANPADEPLHLIEVQSGELLSEDDIERLEDRYGRS